MPQAIPLIAGVAVSSFLGGTGLYLLAAGTLGNVLIGGLVAYGTTRILGLDEVPGLDAPGIKANVRGPVAPIPIVYGKRRVGGVLAQVVTTGDTATAISFPAPTGTTTAPVRIDISVSDNAFLNLVICWCEGEVEGIQTLYFNDNDSTDDAYDGHFTHDEFTGTDTQTAAANFITALANTYTPNTADQLWSTDHRLLGIAYSYLKLEWDQAAWATGIPKVTAEIKGKLVLDVRDSTTAWSDNPALCIYDYLTNARYGRGIDTTEIDTQSFIDAANYCDQIISTSIYSGGLGGILGTVFDHFNDQARYTCDAILNPDDTVMDNLRVLLGTCRGALVFSGGLYKLKIDKPEVSSFNLTADNIVGGWNILLEGSQSRFNRVHSQWINRDLWYQEDIGIVDSPTFLAADNNEILEAKIDLPATCHYLRARQMAGMVLRQSRYSLQCEVTCTIEGLQVEVFDVISVTHETPGWTNQLFRVMGITLESDDQVRLQLVQYADDVYDLDSQNDEDSPAPTALHDPRIVSPIELFEATRFNSANGDGTYRYYYRLAWATNVDDAHIKGFYLRWQVTGATGWNSLIIPYNPYEVGSVGYGGLHYHDLYVPPGTTHEVEMEAYNSLGVTGPIYTDSLLAITAIPISGGGGVGGDEGGA